MTGWGWIFNLDVRGIMGRAHFREEVFMNPSEFSDKLCLVIWIVGIVLILGLLAMVDRFVIHVSNDLAGFVMTFAFLWPGVVVLVRKIIPTP